MSLPDVSWSRVGIALLTYLAILVAVPIVFAATGVSQFFGWWFVPYVVALSAVWWVTLLYRSRRADLPRRE